MINQIQTIKSFVERTFIDAPHTFSIEKDMHGHEIANGDRAVGLVSVLGKRVRIELTSAYLDPPLGNITMTDLPTGHVIAGRKSDEKWAEIAAYIRNGAVAPVVSIEAAKPDEKPAVASPTDGRVPYLGQPVIFCTERGEVFGGMTELAAIVTRVVSPTAVSLTVFPDCGEPFWRTNVPRRVEGKHHYCWDFADAEHYREMLTMVGGAALAGGADKAKRAKAS